MLEINNNNNFRIGDRVVYTPNMPAQELGPTDNRIAEVVGFYGEYVEIKFTRGGYTTKILNKELRQDNYPFTVYTPFALSHYNGPLAHEQDDDINAID